MKIITEITRGDLIRFNLAILPRLKSTYTSMLFISAMVFIWLVWKNGMPNTAIDWIGIIFGSACGGIAGMLAGTLVSFVFILFSSSKTNGTLGHHEYEIRAEGLFEKTPVNEGLSKWAGIHEIRVVGPYLVFRISSFLFHIIPKRSFAREQEFVAFVEASRDAWMKQRA